MGESRPRGLPKSLGSPCLQADPPEDGGPPLPPPAAAPQRPPFAIELCCGSANLSLALRDVGIEAVGVDYVRNASKPRAPCVQLDLTSQGGQDLLWQLLRTSRAAYVHCAPPCGTASRARERPGGPPPLRSAQYPEGLPGLTGLNADRVASANAIYSFVSEFCTECHNRGVLWSIENPARSHMWQCFQFPRLFKAVGTLEVQFDACMHGSNRRKRTAVWTNVHQLQQLRADCDGQHTHASWDQITSDSGTLEFATKQEAVYPPALCRKWARAVADAIQLPANVTGMPVRSDPTLAQSANKQLSGRRTVPHMPEDKEIVVVKNLTADDAHKLHSVVRRRLREDLLLQGGLIPDGARIIEVRQVGKTEAWEAHVALPFSKQEFVDKAVQLPHPVEAAASLEPPLARALFDILTCGPRSLRNRRTATLARLTALA